MHPPTGTPLHIPFWAWIVLGAVVLLSLGLDLVAHRGGKGLGRRTAILASCGWITLSMLFAAWVAAVFGRHAAGDFMSAYLIEKSLSVDNLFVFLVIFSRLRIPEAEQHRVLSWGILGAFVTRAAFIASGTAMLSRWHGVIYVLGAFLIYAGVKTARESPDAADDGKVIAFIRHRFRFTKKLHGHKFFAVEDGRRVATPLLLALLVIEVTDVLFATDSIPAVFAISCEPFIVYSSNVFAILGLRALYLVLAELLTKLEYLRYGLAAILIFAGAKMLVAGVFHIPQWVSLVAIVGILLVTVAGSVYAKRRKGRAAPDGGPAVLQPTDPGLGR